MQKLIILDRDGVINHDSPDYIKSPAEWHAIPSSITAISLLKKKGYLVAIATNQSGIGRGYYSTETLEKIHNKLITLLKETNTTIDKIVFCPHPPQDNCYCRKPKPGMLNEILSFFNIDPKAQTIYFVGDAKRDLLAAKAAFCKPILVKTGKGKQTLQDAPEIPLDTVYNDLLSFAESL